MAEDPHLVLIDGSAFVYRAFHGLPRLLRHRDGMPVGAVAGFSSMLWSQIRRLMNPNQTKRATHLAVVFDKASRNFRHEIYPDYKAHRGDPPEELRPQFPMVRRAVRAFGVPCLEMEGYEADDIIATLTMQACARDFEVTIISSDKDLMQLVGPYVSMFDAMRLKFYDAEKVHQKFGVYPGQMIDFQALVGDTSDNVPGVPGIGVKTAASLLAEWETLDELLGNLDKITPTKRREALMGSRDLILIARQLVTLKFDVPVDFDIDDLHLLPPARRDVMLFLRQMELDELRGKFQDWFDRYG